MTFQGFSPDSVQFLEKLKENNNKEWFEARRADYDRLILDPARALVVALGERLRGIAPELQAQPRVNGSLFRVYRDTRFSQNKDPLKTNVAIWLWEGEGPRMERPGFYFHLEPGEFFLAAGVYQFGTKELLQHWRDAVDDAEFGAALVAAAAQVEAAGLKIDGEALARVPRGYDPAHPRARWLKHKGLTVSAEARKTPPPELFSPALVDWCADRFVQMAPIHAWLREWLRHL